MSTREVARRIAINCESAYSGIGWSANDTDDLTDAIAAALTTARREQAERDARAVEGFDVYSDGDGLRTLDPRGLIALAAAIRAAAKEGKQ